jgi:hypothetical protein
MNTAASPMIEYHVETECGRNFCWSASSLESLFRDLISKQYYATRVMLQSEYEAEQDRIAMIREKLKEDEAA